MFTRAIVREPAASLERGITSAPELGAPVYPTALEQHRAYVQALETCGLTVTPLDAEPDYPDACFIEDVAVCTRDFAMITAPGAETRRGEEARMDTVLGEFYDTLFHIQAPGTLEGGDVMMVGDHFYIGLSHRTNRPGAEQLIKALEQFGYTGSMVEMKEMLHLKTGLSYLEDNHLLITGEFTDMEVFSKFNRILVPDQETYAANCIRVNDYVIVPRGFDRTREAIERAGFKTLAVDTSEYRKLDGGLSCLSLRF